MKKGLIFLLTILFVVSMLFMGIGCKEEAAPAEEEVVEEAAPAEEEEEAAPAEEEVVEEEGPVTIVYMAKWNEGEVLQGIINDELDKYMEDHPNVTIEKIWGGREVNVSLMATIQAGNPPDIYDEDPALINHSIGKEGLALDLTSYIENETAYGEDVKVIDLYAPGYFEPVKWEDGKIYAMPTHQFICVFWYNKTQFEELGITKTPDTWSEFLDLCEEIKGQGVAPLVQDGGIDFYNSYYYTWLADRIEGPGAFREAVFDKTGASFDKPGFLEAAEKVAELYEKGYFIDGFEGYQWPAGQIDWAQGAGAIMLNHTYLPIEIADAVPDDFVFGAFPVPAVEGGKGDQYELDQIVGASAILESSEHPDVAFDILKRILTVEAQTRIIDEALTLPVRTDITLPEQYVDIEGIFANQTGSFTAYAGGPGQIEPEWETVFYSLDDQLLFGKISPEDFIKELKEHTISYWEGKE